MELDDNFKRLIDELGHAINESVSESEKISEVMGRIRASGYDLFLILEVTIGINKQGEPDVVSQHKLEAGERQGEFRLNNQDAQFLRGLKITVDDDPH
ncbi:MAG TPA: hypothetical protein VKU44_06630 [Terriglobia bacterium]|nr:hypothetical protein [Terriglobia bacterium]